MFDGDYLRIHLGFTRTEEAIDMRTVIPGDEAFVVACCNWLYLRRDARRVECSPEYVELRDSHPQC